MTLFTTTSTYQFPWVRLCQNAYSKRLRVSNFDPLGKRGFTEIIRNAVLGETVYFVMQDERPVPVANLTDDYNLEGVENVAWNGLLLGADNEVIDTPVRALTLSAPPITDYAVLLAARANSLDMLISGRLDDLSVPTNVVSGTSPDVDIVKDEKRDSGQWVKFDANEDNTTVIRPEPKRMEQWDNEQVRVLQQLTLQEFMMETSLPPQDAPILDTLSTSTQSLISNRESFVSSTYIIKQDVEAVFGELGIQLDWEITFPQTASDIASIGDAYGKGLDANILKDYQVV